MTVEIIGYASVAPGASSAGELFERLSAGECTVSEIPRDRWDRARFWHPSQGVEGKTYTFAAGVVDSVNDFDHGVFGLSRREAMAMDPQQRLLLTVTWRALEDASLPIDLLREEVVGVYVGASSLDSANLSSEDPASGGPYFMTGNTLSIVANRISHIFGLNGPSLTIDTACSSSLVALDQAVRALERGDVDTAIVGGVNLLNHPLPFVGFAQARMLSPEGLCRPYANEASGYVRAEGAVTVVLRRSDKAQAAGDRSRARIVASGVNSAGRTNGISLPSPEAQMALLQRIYEEAAIDPNQIAFLEGHGTGTKVGDPAEVYAIGQVIGKRRRAPLPLGSIKSNIGHTEPASGLFGLLKAVMALEQNYLPASLFFDTPNEHIDFDDLNVRVNSTPLELLRSRGPRLAGVNSFGFGGTNAHVVVSDPEAVKASAKDRPSEQYFVASAHTETALRELVRTYRDRLNVAAPDEADALILASAAGRSLMRHRVVASVRNGKEAEAALSAYLAGEAASAAEKGEASSGKAKIAFVFAGNGAQWAGMGLDAYRLNKTFRRHFDAASALFEAHIGEKLVDLLHDDSLSTRLPDTRIAQPLLFSIQIAVANCLLAAGIKPAYVLGHSIGEVAAAQIAGAMSLMDAVSVVAARSRSQHATLGRGTMAAALCGEDAANAFLAKHGITDVVVAAVNSRNSITFSGPRESIAEVRALGRRSKIAVQPLDIDYPFHHTLIDDVKNDFLSTLPKISLRPGEFGFLSTVTGDELSGSRLDGNYWWRNAREPVAFRKAVAKALDLGCNLLIEISPRSILSNYLKETVREQATNAQIISTLIKESSEGVDPVARSIARAFAHGADGMPLARMASVDLPMLPFEPEELTVPATSDSYDVFGRGSAVHTLAGWRVDPNGNAWKNHIDAAVLPDIAQHVVEGRAIMPGAGFVEIALQVAQQYYGTSRVSLVNMELLHPLTLDAKLLELSTIVSPETGLIEIRSRERLTTDDWTIHAVARCQKFVETDEQADYEPITARGAGLPSQRIYQIASDFGLNYGPLFRLLTQALTDGQRRVDVDLAPSADPAHPLMEWSVSPMSLDSAFHGLVGLFDQLSGDTDGAPYIPVRFGSIDLLQPGTDIRHARIEIQRFSPHSIKARFVLCDRNQKPVLRIEDCRFRRTWLRQHMSLSSYGHHYETLPWLASAPAPVSIPSDLLSLPANSSGEDSSLLLQAAIYRSCHDIAIALQSEDGLIDQGSLPGDKPLRAFLATCLDILIEAGLSTHEGSGWRVEPSSNLPLVEELLRELQADRPDRGVEAVMVASIHAGILSRLQNHPEEELVAPSLPARSTTEHFRQHSPGANWRDRQVLTAVQKVVDANPGVPLQILMLGSSALGFISTLAEHIGRANGRLVVYEPAEDLRRPLELTFERSARISVVSEIPAIGAYHLVLSSSDRLFSMLDGDDEVFAAVDTAVCRGAHLIAVETASSSSTNFLLGLTPEWQEQGSLAGMQIGRLGSEHDWKRLLGRLEAKPANAVPIDGPFGPVLFIEAYGESVLARASSESVDFILLGAGHGAFPPSASLSLDMSDAELAETLDGVLLRADAPSRIRFVYPGRPQGVHDDEAIIAESAKLARFATAVQTSLNVASSRRDIDLVLLLAGGAPAGGDLSGRRPDPVCAGLWTFARVLANEVDGLSVHLFDAQAHQWRRVLELIEGQHNDREWVLSRYGEQIHVLRAISEPLPPAHANSLNFDAATIRQRTPSRVDSLYWEACAHPSVKMDEVVIEVAAAGLNFRDVMWAMGLLPEEALEEGFAGATIGMELSGRVVAKGEAVTDLEIGDAVMGIGPQAFSTHTTIARNGLAKIPADLDLTAAATVPVAFLTAWYAIVELGRARAGETILIHGAAGGVGLAAIQIAHCLGLNVIATVGSEEKRAYLQMLGVKHIFNSRSLSFVADVKRVTNGDGVDLVLNSLFSDAMEQSIGLVKPFGRFLELGKRDYYSDRKIGLRPFRRNISYFGIDADQLPLKSPQLTGEIFAKLGELFASGELVPLPYRRFRHNEIASAFRLMQNAGHIGKIVITPPVSGQDEVARLPAKKFAVDAKGLHVVIGGIGGFGLAAADWLVQRGARRLALVTRRGIADAETNAILDRWRAKGVTASLHACDITLRSALDGLLRTLRTEAPICGIVHAAMVLDDALLANLNEERFRSVIDVKARGALNLDLATRKDPLDYFLLFSSATTMIGNPGQANYVSANGFLEGLARRRRREGLPGLAVGFGAIADRGYLASNDDVSEILSRRLGNSAMKAATALDFVEAYIANDPGTVDAATVMCSPIDWAVASNLAVVATPLFEVPLRQMHAVASSGSDGIDLSALVADKTESEALDILYKLVAVEMAAVLRVSENSLSPGKVLKDAGLDSLMAVELGLSFKERTGVEIPLSSVGDTTTIDQVVRKLYERVQRAGGQDVDLVDSDADFEALTAQHVDASTKAVNQA